MDMAAATLDENMEIKRAARAAIEFMVYFSQDPIKLVSVSDPYRLHRLPGEWLQITEDQFCGQRHLSPDKCAEVPRAGVDAEF